MRRVSPISTPCFTPTSWRWRGATRRSRSSSPLVRHSTPVLTSAVYTHLALFDQAPALDALPDLTRPAPGSLPPVRSATGTDSVTNKQTLAPYLVHSGDVSGRDQSPPGEEVGSIDHKSVDTNPLKDRCSDPYSRVLTRHDAEGSVAVAGALPDLQDQCRGCARRSDRRMALALGATYCCEMSCDSHSTATSTNMQICNRLHLALKQDDFGYIGFCSFERTLKQKP
jgi:hypothetical protein